MANKWHVVLVGAVMLLVIVSTACSGNSKTTKISEFGQYQGYSQTMYDGSKRTSHYLILASGTRLACDLFLPTKKGVSSAERLPVLFKYTPYDRAWSLFGQDGHDYFCDLAPVWYCDAAMRVRALIVPLLSPGANGAILPTMRGGCT